jgi:WD40 repeat protein
LIPVKLPINDAAHPTVLRWNYAGTTAKLAVGYSDGSIVIWQKQTGKCTVIVPNDRKKTGEVKNIRWDSLSNQYLIATFTHGYLCLVDAEKGSVVKDMERQSFDVSAITFVVSMPGTFLTANENQNLLQVWNVSSGSPKESIKISRKKVGISSIQPTSNTDYFIIAFCDGSVAVFSLINRRLEFETKPAHSDTIFECAFKPSSPNLLATASFDGSVKIWNSQLGECVQVLQQPSMLPSGGLTPNFSSAMTYSVAWCPGGENENKLVCSTSEGEILVWDTKSSKVLLRLKNHLKASLKVVWNPLDPDMLCSTSLDEHITAFSSKGLTLRKIKHPAAVYGCDFSPLIKNYLATACDDCVVRVFDMSLQASSKPLLELKGHTAKVFNVAWSPLLQNILASGSDDTTVRLWDISKPNAPRHAVLKGHKHNVRALAWNHELPWILVSGSWDGTIRVWDVRALSAACQAIIPYHHEDVYGLTSHPHRPFVYASCARDTSLRFWSFDETLLYKVKFSSTLIGMIANDKFTDVDSAMDSRSLLALTGKKSKELSTLINALYKEKEKDKDVDLLKIYQPFFAFMSGVMGVHEIWELVQSILNPSSSPHSTNVITHINDLRRILRLQSKALENTHGHITNAHHFERIQQAADIQLKLGNIKEYCELMVFIGRWERAISVAPAVSMHYWKTLCQKYAQVLCLKNDENAIPYLIASNDPDKLVNFCANSLRHFDDALIAAVTDAVGGYPVIPSLSPEEEASEEKERQDSLDRRTADDDKRDPVAVTARIQKVNDEMAEELLLRGQPVLSACCHLAIGDTGKAVLKLVQGGEIILATAICLTLKQPGVDYLWKIASDRCEAAHLLDEALFCLQQMRDPKHEITLLMARFRGPLQRKIDYYNKAGLKPMEEYAVDGEKLAKERKPEKLPEALVNLVAGDMEALAADVGLPAIAELFSRPAWTLDEAYAIVNPLCSINLLNATANVRFQILSYALYLAILQSMQKQYNAVFVSFLFKSLNDVIAKANTASNFMGGFTFPISAYSRKVLEAQYMVSFDTVAASKLVSELLADAALPPKLKTACGNIKKALDDKETDVSRHGLAHYPGAGLFKEVLPAGFNLPADTKSPALSVISGQNVQGLRVLLEDNTSIISLAEAHMLGQVIPFSPLFTGHRLPLF